MKFIGKLLISLLLILLLLIVLIYMLLQTTWGAGWLGRQLTRHSGYQVSLGNINHRWTQFSEIQLDNVNLGKKGALPTLVAKRVVAELGTQQLTDPWHVNRLQLQDGTLNLDPAAPAWPLQADTLQLNGMAVHAPHGEWRLNGQNVNAGISPWRPQAGYPLGRQARFQLSARSLTLNGVPAQNVLVQGEINNQALTLDNLGADLYQGELTGTARRATDGSWQVDSLWMSNVRLQSDKTLHDFLRQVFSVPKITLRRADLIDARMEGRNWAFNDLDLTLRDMTFQDGDWSAQDGSLSFNASDLINGGVHLTDTLANMTFSPQGVEIRQFSGRWELGLLRTSGRWRRQEHRLALDELMIAGLEYTLPANWRASWLQSLPPWLASVSVERLSANRNLIIDITPAFPFQITALDVTGRQLVLARDHQWGVWSGSMTLNGSDATFNKTDVRQPSLTLDATGDTLNISELSAFTGEGLLEATAAVSQRPARDFTLSLNGRAVAANVLHNWGWPTLPLTGNVNLKLQLRGQMTAAAPLKPSLNGTLQAQNTTGQTLNQTLRHGDVTATPEP
ncbi:yicH [Candidatus Sodalis pierantonius str. SOPE]|uniref:YicH n=1 Tax=Candidatus Sodalis pierantonii str. SOPE TaxID=2342 RepID=W0HRB8_9GAMM|nr:AsmA family protein [Candidatus Sodalis pierantonius]AHF74683.1 yicH [Candidatus Sodalis pierantonius str. SOPE]